MENRSDQGRAWKDNLSYLIAKTEIKYLSSPFQSQALKHI